MKAALLDTDILSEFFRGNHNVVRNVELYLDEFEELNTSVITYYEIRNGLLYKDAHKQLVKFEAFSKINNTAHFSRISGLEIAN